MSRSVKKGPFIAHHLYKKIDKMKATGKTEVITTWARSSTILPIMVGFTIAVYMENNIFQFLFQINL